MKPQITATAFHCHLVVNLVFSYYLPTAGSSDLHQLFAGSLCQQSSYGPRGKGTLTVQDALLDDLLGGRARLELSLQAVALHVAIELLLVRHQRGRHVGAVFGQNVALLKLFLGRAVGKLLLELVLGHCLFEV